MDAFSLTADYIEPLVEKTHARRKNFLLSSKMVSPCIPKRSLPIKKMQKKIILSFHFTPVRITTMKNTNSGMDIGKGNSYLFIMRI